jgi:hypothetical protein
MLNDYNESISLYPACKLTSFASTGVIWASLPTTGLSNHNITNDAPYQVSYQASDQGGYQAPNRMRSK